jgi:hypothetical protein
MDKIEKYYKEHCQPAWVFDLWLNGAADCYNAEVMAGCDKYPAMWSAWKCKLVHAWGSFQMFIWGWWRP